MGIYIRIALSMPQLVNTQSLIANSNVARKYLSITASFDRQQLTRDTLPSPFGNSCLQFHHILWWLIVIPNQTKYFRNEVVKYK